MDCVLYVRVSSKEQADEGFSIPSQYKLLREFAKSKHFKIIREFEDTETAKRSGRYSFEQMLAYLRENQSCRTLLVEKTDRLYRNLKDWVTLDELGLDIHLVKENTLISPDSRSNDKLIHGIKVVMAKHYIENLSEEARKGLHQKASEGLWPSNAPLGYRNVMGPNGKKIIEIDPVMGPLVTKLFREFAEGYYSVKMIAKKFNDSGLVFRKSGKSLLTASIHKMLRNRIYTGDFDYAGKTFKGTHEGLVPFEIWERVQKILDGRRINKAQARYRFPYSSGIIKCGHCGCAIVAEAKKKGRYIYYHCTNSRGYCYEPYVKQEDLTQMIAKELEQLYIKPEQLKTMTKALLESHQDEKEFHNVALDRLNGEFKEVQTKIDTVYEDRLSGHIDVFQYERKTKELRERQQRIAGDIKRLGNANQNYLESGVRLLEVASNAKEIFLKLEGFERQKFLRLIWAKAHWKHRTLTIEFESPFSLIALSNSQIPTGIRKKSRLEAENKIWRRERDSNPRYDCS